MPLLVSADEITTAPAESTAGQTEKSVQEQYLAPKGHAEACTSQCAMMSVSDGNQSELVEAEICSIDHGFETKQRSAEANVFATASNIGGHVQDDMDYQMSHQGETFAEDASPGVSGEDVDSDEEEYDSDDSEEDNESASEDEAKPSKKRSLSDHADNNRRVKRRKLDRAAAQRVILHFFRSFALPKSSRRVARLFLKYGPTLEEAKKIAFEVLSGKLRLETVIDACGNMLLRIIQYLNWDKKGKPCITGSVNVKIFLAAYMIAARPNHVFESIGDLEKKVLEASEPMLKCFHKTAIALSLGQPWSQVKQDVAKELSTLLCTYLRTFKEWKIVDEKKLAGRLKHALRGLEQAEKALKDEDVESKMRKELRNQQQRLRVKLAQIAGDKEVEAHDREQRESESKKAGGASSVMGSTAATVAKSQGVSGSEASGASSQQSTHVGGMTNEQLAHELLLDPDFRLDDKAGMSDEKLVHTKIRETFERAFWESLVEDLSCSPPSYTRVLSVLVEIRNGIQSLSQGQAEARQIQEIIDIEHITEQLKKDTLDYKGCEGLIESIVTVLMEVHKRMKANERRQETMTKWEAVRDKMQEAGPKGQGERARAMCEALELVLDRVHAVRVDTANNKLKAIAPVIREHGVEYEMSHFRKKLESGKITLVRTEQWMSYTVDQLVRTRDTRVSTEDLARGVPKDFEAVLYVGITELVADYPHWGGQVRGRDQEDDVPETMQLDLLRVKALNAHFHTDVVSTIILVTAEAEIKTRMRDGIGRSQLLKSISKAVVANPPKPNNPKQTIKAVMDEIAAVHLTEADKATILKLIEKHVDKTHPVYALMAKRLKLYWFEMLKNEGRPIASAREMLKVSDVAMAVVSESDKHAARLSSIALLNKKVHVARYNKMIAQAVRKVMP